MVHDIQATLQDAIFCCCKAKAYSPEDPLYLVRNGTDPAECFFGVFRAKNKNCNLDSREFIHCASALSQVDHIIMNKHPEWSKSSRLSKRLCLDYSSIDSWDKEKLVLLNVDVVGTFKVGKLNLSAMLLEHGLQEIDFDGLSREGVTFIGVNNCNVDWSIPNDDVTVADVNDDEEVPEEDINLGDFISGKYDATVDIDGKHVFKATCVKEAFSSEPLSKDRLKRVRTMSSLTSSEAPSKLLHVGDPVVVTKSGISLANITCIKSANKAVKFIDMNLLESENLQFTLMQLVLVEKEGKYFWTGEFEGDAFIVTGKDCIPIQPNVDLGMAAEGCTPYCFDKQLVLDIGVHLQRQPSDTMVNNNPGSSRRNNISNSDVSALCPCYMCQKKTTLEMMQGHIALHIILGDTQGDVCGFCGQVGSSCDPTLKQSSHRAGKVFYTPWAECSYRHLYKRVPNNVTKMHQCTNKLMFCPANNCKSTIWKYNGVHHYEDKHPDLAIPFEFIVSNEEKKAVKRVYAL